MTDRNPLITEYFSINRAQRTEPSNSRIDRNATKVLKPVRIALLISAVLLCNLINGQHAFSGTQLTLDMDENPGSFAREGHLEALNEKAEGAINTSDFNLDHFCYELKPDPVDFLKFIELNCTFGDSTVANGFTSARGFQDYHGLVDAIVPGDDNFDFDTRERHTLEVIAHRHADGSTPTTAILNKLTITFNVIDFDEAPEFKQPGVWPIVSHLRVGDQINYSILDFYEDPEGEAMSIDVASMLLCEPPAVDTIAPLTPTAQRCKGATTMIAGDYVSIEQRGPRISIKADGQNLTDAGFYYAVMTFDVVDAMDPDIKTGPTAEIRVYIKSGNNNPPEFSGGSIGFTASATEVPLTDKNRHLIAPAPPNAWEADDLDKDVELSHVLVGSQAGCPDLGTGWSQIGKMCIRAADDPNGYVRLETHYLDYEDRRFHPDKSFTVMLRASDGWDQTDIPITVTIDDVNELYLHNDPMTGLSPMLPLNVSVIEGQTVDLNLSQYVTDPENDTLTFMAYAYNRAELVQLNSTNLSIKGVGTDANTPTFNDTITVEVTDGQLTRTHDIKVRVRNMNQAPEVGSAGVIIVGGDIDENSPAGTVVSGLVQYSDPDSSANELSVLVDSPLFEGLVNPLLENGTLCQVASATCVEQTGQIALVTTAPLNFESTSRHDVKIGMYDGWARSDPSNDLTVRITVKNLNDPPEATGSVPNLALSVSGTSTFDASPYFSDEDSDDRLIVTATSTDTSVATADVASTAADITVTGLGRGKTRIELIATDRAGLTDSHFFDVTVSANQMPIAQPDAFKAALPENAELLVNAGTFDVPLTGLFVDPDGDHIDLSVSSSDTSTLLVSDLGDVAVLVPRKVGVAELIFVATDTAGNEATEIRTIDVVSQLTASNQHPVLDQAALDQALPDDRKMVVNSFHDMMIAGIFTDPEGGTLHIRLSSSDADVLQIQKSAETTVRFYAVGEGTSDLTIVARDEGDLETEAKVTIQVVGERPVTGNQAPVLDSNAFSQALPPDRSIIVQRFHRMDLRDLFTDPEGDSFTLRAESSDPSKLRVSLSSGGTSAFLVARAIGSAVLTITATDSQGNSTPAVATIKVIEQDTNRPPVVDEAALTAALPANNTLPALGNYIELQLDELFSDPDGDDDIVALEGSSSNPDVLDVYVDDTNLLTAFPLSQGTAVLTLVARDKAGAEATVSETITVTAASAASLAIGSQTLDRSAPLALQLDALTSDVHTRALVHDLQSTVGDPSILTSSVDGSTLTLHARKQGRTFVKLFNSDTGETAIRSMFYVDVVNAAPTLVASLSDQSATRVDGLSIDLHGAFEDADGEAIEISVRALDDSIIAVTYEAGTLAIQGLQVGQTAVTVTAVDIHGAATETTFNVTIENVAPVLRSQVGTIQLQVGGEPYHLDFNEVFTDDGDALSYTIALDALNIVQPDASATGVTYTPLTRGKVGLTVTATDPYGGQASFAPTIIVGDERLREVAEKSLAGFGRTMLSSVSAAIANRANLERVNSDLSNDSWRPAARAERDGGIRPPSASRNAASDAMAHSSLWVSYLNDEHGFDASASQSFSPIQNGFSINLGAGEKTSPWSVWSNTDRQMYAGDAYDGTVTNTYLGVDKAIGESWVMGISVAKHRGESDYSYGTASQRLDLDLTQLLPYARYSPSDRTSIWGTLGVGRGELGTTVTGGADTSSELVSHLAMLGARQHVASLMQIDLALRGEVAEVSLQSAAGESGSAGLSANVQRARVGIEGSYATNWFNDVAITPFGQLNLRTDRGDGDPGSGLEFTGGLKVDLRSVSLEMVGHTFEMRGQQPYRESGLQMTASVNPAGGGSGFSASITPRWGAVAQADGAVWNDFSASARTRHGNSPHQHPVNEPRMQVDSQLGYGFLLANEGLLLTPFVQYAQSESDRQQAQLGAQLQQATRGTSSFSSRIGLGRVMTANKQDETSIGVSFQLTF